MRLDPAVSTDTRLTFCSTGILLQNSLMPACRYHVRLDPAVSTDTRLLFCTTGILLRRLAGDPRLASVSHVVVDEVHERSLQGDFLLALLKRLVALRAGTPAPLKLVLMSATIDAAQLAAYCGGCAKMAAQGRTFPVEQLFLEDVYERTGYRLADDAPAALRRGRGGGMQRQAEKQGGAPSAHLCAYLLPIVVPIFCPSL